MDIVQTDQLVTVLLFLAVLIAAMLWVQGNRGKLSGKMAKGRRMTVAEATAIGPDTKAVLLDIDGQDYLIVTARKQPPVITPLQSASTSRATNAEQSVAPNITQPDLGPQPVQEVIQ